MRALEGRHRDHPAAAAAAAFGMGGVDALPGACAAHEVVAAREAAPRARRAWRGCGRGTAAADGWTVPKRGITVAVLAYRDASDAREAGGHHRAAAKLCGRGGGGGCGVGGGVNDVRW